MEEDYVPAMRNPELRDQILKDVIAELLLFIRQERENDPTLPDIREIRVKKESDDRTLSWDRDSWVVWAIMDNGRTYQYAWYINTEGQVVADGF